MSAQQQFDRLVEIMTELRSENGCPWDLEQTHASIRAYCIEEAYEVVEAIDENDMEKLREELGDLLLQVVFHAQMAQESGSFTIQEVLNSINEKLVRRHPHVFDPKRKGEMKTPSEVLEKWADIKKSEGRKNLLDGIPKTMPALLRAARVGEKASSVGFDWKDAAQVWEKVMEELGEVKEVTNKPKKLEEEFGDLLFALANLSRHLKLDAENSLRTATDKFEKRFRWMESKARDQGKELAGFSPSQWEDLWEQAKKEFS